MAVTGQQIRERILRQYPELGLCGKTTALGGSNYLTDTTFLQGSRYSPSEFGDAWVRLTGVSNSDEGLISQLERIDPVNGYAYLSPAPGAPIVSGCTYEIWGKGIRPDLWDAGRDRAATERCQMWRMRALSQLSGVEEWPASAYDATAGGVSNAAAAVQSLDFPTQYFEKSMLVTNSAGSGYISSEKLGVVPGHAFRVFGYVSVRQAISAVRVRDLTNNADITLTGDTTETALGWQYFDLVFTVPSGCYALQVWLGGTLSTSITEWAGVGLLNQNAMRFNLPARVISEAEVGMVFARLNISQRADEAEWVEVACKRQRSASRVEIVCGGRPAGTGGVYYMEAHHYAALQSDYLTKADRLAGDAASTDCPLPYIAAATVVETLEKVRQDDDLKRIYLAAEKDLAAWNTIAGAPPVVVSQKKLPARRPMMLELR